MPAGNVRTHMRKRPGGGATTVRQPSRQGRGRNGLVRPGRAWENIKRAGRALRRRKRGTAAGLGFLALLELLAWVLLQCTAAALATLGVLALAVAWLAAMASGVNL
jgi:hypothetical protein